MRSIVFRIAFLIWLLEPHSQGSFDWLTELPIDVEAKRDVLPLAANSIGGPVCHDAKWFVVDVPA